MSRSFTTLRSAFLALLPRVEAHGRVYFRHVRCRDSREDAVREMVALAWKWCLGLARRGKDPACFPSALATFAARAVKSGRKLCGSDRVNDVLAPRTRNRYGFTVFRLTDRTALNGNVLEEALRENKQTPVPDQVIFRVDFPAWLKSRTKRDRKAIKRLMLGERTDVVARMLGISPSRVSQLRRAFMEDWERFGDTDRSAE